MLQVWGVMSLLYFGHFFTLKLVEWVQVENSWCPPHMSNIKTFQRYLSSPLPLNAFTQKDQYVFYVEYYLKFLVQKRKHTFSVKCWVLNFLDDNTICSVMISSTHCFYILQKEGSFEQMLRGPYAQLKYVSKASEQLVAGKRILEMGFHMCVACLIKSNKSHSCAYPNAHAHKFGYS